MLMINKASGWTSFDVVNKLRYALKIKQIGHAGTLDPLATGLLLVCTGQQTKQISKLQDLKKVYIGQIGLGKTTPSMDLETPFDQTWCCDHLSYEMVYEAAASFVGHMAQIPPIYSARKVHGKRAYALARQGQIPLLEPRPIVIDAFTITAIAWPLVSFKLVCSKGTYVRRLAYDLGEKLGVGAYLHALCRVQIGPYSLDQAWTIENLLAALDRQANLERGETGGLVLDGV